MNLVVPDLDVRIGQRIRDLRAERNLTLDALAQRADVSRAMVSRIERGESSPTAQLLNKICGGLGITLSALFAETQAPASPLARYQDQPTWRDPATHYLRRSVTPPGTGAPVDIAEIEFPPGATVTFDNRHVAASGQHVWILDGTLDLTVGPQSYHLETGDCLMMRFGQPIVFHNPAAEPARYAVIIHQGGHGS